MIYFDEDTNDVVLVTNEGTKITYIRYQKQVEEISTLLEENN